TGEGKGSGQGTGIYAAGGETVTLTEVTISRVQTGVYAEKGTLIMKDGTTIEFTGNYGVSVGNDVKSADLTRVKITGKGKGTGVYAVGGNVMVSGGEIKKGADGDSYVRWDVDGEGWDND
ncbi:right-handed parallel beta-helix repeat-containing protein, partial [Bartonella schoenbuchensis]